jgi:hypothetical protein
LEFPVVTNLPADLEYIELVKVTDEMNNMGDPCIDETHFHRFLINKYGKINFYIVRVGKSQFYHITFNFSVDDACPGFKRQPFSGYSFDKSETGCTPSSITAHICFRTVGIEKTPPEIGTIRIFYDEHTVSAH